MLDQLLQQLTPYRNAPAWHIAFSGGLDSTVLLHQLAELARLHALPPLSAIHVHHGLQAAADDWPAHCEAVCAQLGIPLQVIRVEVQPGASLEQAARDARYQAFIECLQAGEVLLTAQHRDDQAETLLFRLLRGAGVRGLAAMPRKRVLGAGLLVRPLIDVPRARLHGWATERQVPWVEDPSNADDRPSRNFLRLKIFPALVTRWPQASQNMARAAAHVNEALQLLEELGHEDLEDALMGNSYPWLGVPTLSLPPLRRLSAARQRNALQTWLAPLTRLPDATHWAGWHDLRDATPAATPIWRLADGELHASQKRIWWLSGYWLQPPLPVGPWLDPSQPLLLPGNGELRWTGDIAPGHLEVRYRQGGETMNLQGRGHRDLKRLLNEIGVPAFARARLPLLYLDGELYAVANQGRLNRESAMLKWSPPNNDASLARNV
ncbi:tRNA lysidine(34) synthetase TilS [Pseudomonas sp. MWU16-30317]|uniref:tRNA lysidine(34) synthetase TilS n=1 Tax=Pseudomonas sp. MWU16-30317 TaxID=2878095 RepID=UPI001CFA615A|nr:tRNA lysidine(34) synthetase TilS [Pseudomonas sp. MWU16-30317]